MEEGEAIDTDTSDEERDESVFETPTCSRMTVPLLGPGRRPLGIVHIDTNDHRHCFEAEDLEVLMSVAAIAKPSNTLSSTSGCDWISANASWPLLKKYNYTFCRSDRQLSGYQFFDFLPAWRRRGRRLFWLCAAQRRSPGSGRGRRVRQGSFRA